MGQILPTDKLALPPLNLAYHLWEILDLRILPCNENWTRQSLGQSSTWASWTVAITRNHKTDQTKHRE